jgi:hypothetical protein
MNNHASFFTKVIGAVGSGALVAIIMFFVWLANIATRVSVIEETRIAERRAADSVESANKESLARIEHEREANDARVRDDLRELRLRVYPNERITK